MAKSILLKQLPHNAQLILLDVDISRQFCDVLLSHIGNEDITILHENVRLQKGIKITAQYLSILHERGNF